LKEYLLPGFDRAYPALIEDLDARGMLDETLVLWLSEHGRTPKIDSRWKGGGRDHWSRAYSVALAGGGVARGRVIGETDSIGGDVKSTAFSPKDLLATALHLLGHDPDTQVRDREGRPVRAVGDGRLREEVLA
jgi:arylsulfatase A-like enzyme